MSMKAEWNLSTSLESSRKKSCTGHQFWVFLGRKYQCAGSAVYSLTEVSEISQERGSKHASAAVVLDHNLKYKVSKAVG